MSTDSSFYLFKLSDVGLDTILSLSTEGIDLYIEELLEKFYPDSEEDKKKKLVIAYKGSFALEKYIRITDCFEDSFTPIYTKTGLIRELVNDVYSIGSEKLAIN